MIPNRQPARSPSPSTSVRAGRLGGLAAFLLAASAFAQAPAPAAAPASPSPEQTLAKTRALLAASQARETALRDELIELDRQMDARVDEVVDLLKGVQDSTGSKTEIAHVKKQAIEALQKWIQAYAQERGRRLGQIQGPGTAAAREDAQREVDAIQAEIDARADQIVELAASMKMNEDVARYDTYYNDGSFVRVQRDEYESNKRQDSLSGQTRSAVAEDLEKAIAAIERDLALVPQRLPRDRQQAELDRLQALLDERRADLRALSTASAPEAREVSDSEANQFDRELRYAQEDIRDLWVRFQAQANLLAAERQRRRQLESRVKYVEQEMGAPAAE